MNAEPTPRVRPGREASFGLRKCDPSELSTGLFFAGWTPGASGRRLTSYNLQEDAHPNNGGTGL